MEGFTFLHGEGHSQVLQIKGIVADTYIQEEEYVIAETYYKT